MEEKEEEIQLYQIIDIDKTTDQPAGLLDYWSPNDTLRTLALSMDWAHQSLETSTRSPQRINSHTKEDSLASFIAVALEVPRPVSVTAVMTAIFSGMGGALDLEDSFYTSCTRWDPILKCVFTYLFPVLSPHHNNPRLRRAVILETTYPLVYTLRSVL